MAWCSIASIETANFVKDERAGDRMKDGLTADPSFVERIGQFCDSDVVRMASVSGGDFATAYQVDLADGRCVFAKTHRQPPPGFFTTEAKGLTWLADSNAINVARVIGAADDPPACLVLNWIAIGRPSGDNQEAVFGRQLANLHRSGAPHFGRSDSRTTGSQALPNDPCSTWSEFYADQRLKPLATIAADANALPRSTIDGVLAVADRLEDFGAADEPPARIHGDLWAGNRVIDFEGVSWLIDPAAHGGHREFDLAMMQLFGGFGSDCFESYDEIFPLASGWRERIPLHQLAPLVVHAIKFGGSYPSAVESALASLS